MSDTSNENEIFEGEEEFAKKDKKSRRSDKDGGGLNINSMMDIMTILLVFLLVTITSDPLNITQDSYLKLANSTADYEPEDSVPVTITKRSVIVDHKAVVKVDCTTSGGQVCQDESDYERPDNRYVIDKSFKEDGSESSFLIQPLYKRLDEIVKQLKAENKELGREYKGVVTIICDKDIPFRIIAEIVHTAGMAGLSELRFAIIKGGAR